VQDIDDVSYEALRLIARRAEAIRTFYAEVEAVRQQAEPTVLLANHRCDEQLEKPPKTTGMRGLIQAGV
jgi:hypothetical protein